MLDARILDANRSIETATALELVLCDEHAPFAITVPTVAAADPRSGLLHLEWR